MDLYAKLAEVAKSVDHLTKQEKGYKYKYVSSSQVITALRAKWLELGLLLQLEVNKIDVRPAPEFGGRQHVVTVLMEYKWVNTEDISQALQVSWSGTGMDTDTSKALGKALTYSEKYFLLKYFQIPTDADDPDARQTKQQPIHQHTWTDVGRKKFFAICKAHGLTNAHQESFRDWLVQQAKRNNPAVTGLDDNMINYLADNFDNYHAQWKAVMEYYG